MKSKSIFVIHLLILLIFTCLSCQNQKGKIVVNNDFESVDYCDVGYENLSSSQDVEISFEGFTDKTYSTNELFQLDQQLDSFNGATINGQNFDALSSLSVLNDYKRSKVIIDELGIDSVNFINDFKKQNIFQLLGRVEFSKNFESYLVLRRYIPSIDIDYFSIFLINIKDRKLLSVLRIALNMASLYGEMTNEFLIKLKDNKMQMVSTSVGSDIIGNLPKNFGDKRTIVSQRFTITDVGYISVDD